MAGGFGPFIVSALLLVLLFFDPKVASFGLVTDSGNFVPFLAFFLLFDGVLGVLCFGV